MVEVAEAKAKAAVAATAMAMAKAKAMAKARASWRRRVWTVASGRLVWERADAVSRGRRLIARSGLRVRLWRWARYGHGGLGEPEGAWGLAARFERGSGFRVVGGFLR